MPGIREESLRLDRSGAVVEAYKVKPRTEMGSALGFLLARETTP